MSIVGEALLSASFELLFNRLASLYLLSSVRQGQVHADIKKWEKMLRKIQAVLDDAEEKQMKNRLVKIWLDELRDLAYDMEDILDEFATEALRLKLMEEPRAITSKVRKFIPTCFNLSTVMISSKMGSKIKEITTRLQELATQKNELELKENACGRSIGIRGRLPTTSLVNEAHVYGRGDDKKVILELLLQNKGNDDGVSVIPIVGMGGIGKTTLAQLVYNDDRVKGYFDLKAWVCVSEEFNVVSATKIILQSVTSEASDVNDLNLLQVKLQEILSRKKFLIVLDDVWHENYDDWTLLRRPFEAGASGSKIVVTTRIEGVASIMGNIAAYHLKQLSINDCFFVFTVHALGTKDFSAHPNLKEIGEKIVKKCNGLPLAAKTLGGLLRTKLDQEEWENILNSKIWDIPEEKSGIIPALRLSYYHLPPHLKQCFAYCSIFPKNYEFRKEELILLWMAEGFLQQVEDQKQIEELGGGYFQDLLLRSFFQVSSRDKSRFVMHDLINALAQSVAGEFCFQLEGDKQLKIPERARHSSYIGGCFDGVEKFEGFHGVKSLRTFLPLMLPCYGYCYITSNVLLDLLPELRCLRVLSLSGYYITQLPNLIGDLKHLRYLDFSYTQIRSLPDSVTTLYNLQTLILKKCSNLEKLPAKICNLINLHHLDLTAADSIKEMPLGIGKLTYLRTLTDFIVGQGNGSQIRELMNLSKLHGVLSISGLENVFDAQDACQARLRDKTGLHGLELEWNRDFDNDSRSTRVLDMLQPHNKLKELTIKYYGGTRFSTWVGDPSFKKIESLNLENCKNNSLLPPLGHLPSLKNLSIKGMHGVNTVDFEFYGEGCSKPFPSLETLHFEDMPEWKEWNASEVHKQVERFPRLCNLSVKKCPKLSGKLPEYLPSLEELVIYECEQLVVSTSSLPNLCILKIDGCEEVVHRSMPDFSSLKSMHLSGISKLTCLTDGFMWGLKKLENLEIGGCEELTSLWQNEVRFLQHLSSLRHLEIRCPRLASLGENVEEKEENLQLGLSCSLESLTLNCCERLEKLPIALNSLMSLRVLYIYRCPRLVSFPVTILPSTLSRLKIASCQNLQALLDEGGDINVSSTSPSLLEYLEINLCRSLRCLYLSGKLPTSLKHLSIKNCPELEFIVETFHINMSLEEIIIDTCKNLKSLPEGLHNLSHLRWLEIESCRSLGFFPEGGFPSTNLRYLRIRECEKLEALPDRMKNLNSLQDLWIHDCPSIISFPEKGFPTNITSLGMFNLKICKPLFEWGLHRLTSLGKLCIIGGCSDVVTFPQEDIGMLLPTSLTSLSIQDFPNLKYLSSNGFQNLSSLEYLYVSDCPKLTSFPKMGLLSSLSQLYIKRCPLLKQRCKRDKGQDWLKIANIPCVYIDNKFIYDPEEHE